jgi:hypothetical protein
VSRFFTPVESLRLGRFKAVAAAQRLKYMFEEQNYETLPLD